jgi:hypothetical protein
MSITPLTSLPPLASYGSSEGDSLKSMVRTRPPLIGAKIKAPPPQRPMMGAISIKRSATNIGGPSKRLASMLSGNTSSTSSFHTTKASLSHTLVGIDLPNGGRGKGFMRRATLLKVLAKTTSSAPLRIPRKNLRKALNVVESKSWGEPLPIMTFLMSRVDALTSIVERLESDLEKKEAKNAQLVEDHNKLCHIMLLFIMFLVCSSLFMTFYYFNIMLLFIMFLVCSSLLLNIVIIDDEYMHMFVEHLIQYSSELSGRHYISVVLRYCLPTDALYMLGHVVDYGCDTPVESFVVHSPYIEQVESRLRRKGKLYS